MTYVKRLSDYALAGGSGKGKWTGSKLTRDPDTGALLSIGRGGGVSGRVSGPRTGDLVGFRGFGDEKGTTYRTTGELKGASKRYIEGLTKDRKKLEDKWAKAQANESAKDKFALDSFNAIMKTMPKDMLPEEQKAWMQQPHVQEAAKGLKSRMVRQWKANQGLMPEQYSQAYGLKVGGKVDPRFAPPQAAPKTAPTQQKKRGVVQMQLKGSGAPVELRGRLKDGRILVQDPVTLKQFPVTKEELEKRGAGKGTSGWTHPDA